MAESLAERVLGRIERDARKHGLSDDPAQFARDQIENASPLELLRAISLELEDENG